MNSKRVGVIVEVNNQLSKVGVYNLLNDDSIIWKGELLSGIKVGAYLTINQNDVKIIAMVSSEKVVDQRNSVNSTEFDNRFHKGSINRIVEIQTKGVIENNKFKITSKYTPMVGNEVTLTTIEELSQIFGLKKDDKTIVIGKTIMEEYPVKIPVNKFFASHIGIFGNTGSGKSNTLHKLYLELFKSEFKEKIKEKSKFFLVDFNGEYSGDYIFGLDFNDRKIIKINTKINTEDFNNKLNIKSEYLFDADILSILFDARPATQVPFLKKAVKKYLADSTAEEYSKLEIGLLVSILKLIKSNTNLDLLNNWILAAKNTGISENKIQPLEDMQSKLNYGMPNLCTVDQNIILENGQLTEDGKQYLKINDIKAELKTTFEGKSKLQQFLSFLEFQRVYEITYESTKSDFINPLFNRIRPAINALDKVINIPDNYNTNLYKTMNIISLVHANTDVKRLIPMLISKMLYDEHKKEISETKTQHTVHLIIDEAHNILNSQYKNVGDDWQDYRLSVFEEIIKEGRKFGFFLTLASQRPADISPTIISQLHNFIIHRLVNERDLQMIANTMPTIDLATYRSIPLLGQGEAIFTGTATSISIVAKVDKEEIAHPDSDDVVLTDLWQ